MLVVSRKQDESIVIGNEIEIVIVRIDRHNVRIGIKAPRSVSVHRKEVFEEIRQENLEATKQAGKVNADALQKLIGSKLKKKE
jgi:carbon storage regulator